MLLPTARSWAMLMTAVAVRLYIAMRKLSRSTICAELAAKAAAEETARAQLAATAAAEEDASEIQRLRTVLSRLRKAQDLHAPIPSVPSSLRPCVEWTRCVVAMAAALDGYHSTKAKRARKDKEHPKSVLHSSYDLGRAGGEFKHRVSELLAEHTQRHLPDLAREMHADSRLVMLLLDAPSCGTTNALARAVPGLRAHGVRICVPQADPSHYALMVGDPAACHPPAGATAGVPIAAGGTPADGMLLGVRLQRLDEWLSSNARKPIRVPLFFADYETSIYGRQSMELSPLADLQRFFRNGYAHTRCLLGVTLSYRADHNSRYGPDAPQLTPDDLAGFVATEAAAQGLESCLLETYLYGMTFSLFLLTVAEGAADACAAETSAAIDDAADSVLAQQASAAATTHTAAPPTPAPNEGPPPPNTTPPPPERVPPPIEFVVRTADAGRPIEALLVKELPRDIPSHGSALLALKRGQILLDGETALKGNAVAAGQRVQFAFAPARRHLARTRGCKPPLDVACMHADDWLAIVLKPAGVSVQGDAGSVELRHAVNWALPPPSSRPDPLPHPRFVHRIDKETSGLLVFARTTAANAALGMAFADHGTVRKTPLALLTT